ncbi:MAG: hypothetical protein PUC19_06330 [Ligilactobacillus ruminis]|nr:hypothetical protein [Ligilactobacillus ruminis]
MPKDGNDDERLGKTMPQIEKPDDFPSIANLIRFFECMTPDMMEIIKNSLAVNLSESLAESGEQHCI